MKSLSALACTRGAKTTFANPSARVFTDGAAGALQVFVTGYAGPGRNRGLLGRAGAGYGFDAITTMARYAVESLETAEQDAEAIRKSVNDLVQTLRRTRPGVPIKA